MGVEGGNHLESVRWKNNQTGQTEEHKISHIFIMTGADPNTSWLDGRIALDSKGFIKTGPDLSQENLKCRRTAITCNHVLWIVLPHSVMLYHFTNVAIWCTSISITIRKCWIDCC